MYGRLTVMGENILRAAREGLRNSGGVLEGFWRVFGANWLQASYRAVPAEKGK
jgi:hypothetical protein